MNISKGFTLLEVLVTLIIATMVSTLAFQLLFVNNMAVDRALNKSKRITINYLSSNWMFKVLNCIVSTKDSDIYRFRGTKDFLRAKTLCPLLGEEGMPTAFKLQVDNTSHRVFYSELSEEFFSKFVKNKSFSEFVNDFQDEDNHDSQLFIEPFPIPVSISYLYEDKASNQWPIEGALGNYQYQQIPSAMVITAASDQQHILTYIKPDGRRKAPFDIHDVSN